MKTDDFVIRSIVIGVILFIFSIMGSCRHDKILKVRLVALGLSPTQAECTVNENMMEKCLLSEMINQAVRK